MVILLMAVKYCDCAHSRPLNCNLKGRAFWWMVARLAGWDGEARTPLPVPGLGDYLDVLRNFGRYSRNQIKKDIQIT